MTRVLLYGCFSVLLLFCAAVVPSRATLTVTETPLGKAIPTVEGYSTFFIYSADGQHFAHMAAPVKSRVCVVVDGKPRMLFADRTTPQTLIDVEKTFLFSPDATRTAYTAVLNGTVHAVIDEQVGPPFDEVKRPCFSADSKSVAYWARTDTSWVRMVNGQETLRYTISTDRPPVFSPHGDHLAIVQTNGALAQLVVDGVLYPSYDKIESITLTDGDPFRVAYVARRGKTSVVVVDGKESPNYDKVFSLSFSTDGKHVLYRAGVGGKQMVVIDGVPKKAYDQVGIIYANADASGVAYLAYTAPMQGKWCVVWNDREGPPLNRNAFSRLSSSLTFSRNGQHIGYIIKTDDAQVAFVVDDKVQPPVKKLDEYRAAVSPDGTHFAYIVMQEKDMQLVIDGKADTIYSDIGLMDYGPDDTSLVFVGIDREGNQGVFVNGRQRPNVDSLAQVATPDNKHIIELVTTMQGEQQLSIDNDTSSLTTWQAYEDHSGRWFVFDGPNKGHFFAHRDGIDLRIDVEIP